MRSRRRSSGRVSEPSRRIDRSHKREAADGPCVAHDFPQPAGNDEPAERRGDPPVQRHEGGGRCGSISGIQAKTVISWVTAYSRPAALCDRPEPQMRGGRSSRLSVGWETETDILGEVL